jgi:nucleoside-diphosphate-sugar epimerase
MRILITGAGGYLGKGLVPPLAQRNHSLRLMDVVRLDTPHDQFTGSVADLAACREATKDIDAIVIAHMAKNPDAYVDPTLPFDINVKGTANLLFAAAERKIRKIVLISSAGVTAAHDTADHSHILPPKTKGMYQLTKALQEVMAEQFARGGMSVAVLRIGYLVDGDTGQDKYGRTIDKQHPLLTDPRDVGEAASLALDRGDISYEVFPVVGVASAITQYDTAHTRKRLGWTPKYDFAWLEEKP